MIINKSTIILWGIIIFSLMGGQLLISGATPAVRAKSGLPGRATPTPVPTEKDKDHSGPVGATIELTGAGASVGDWTVVQWQDSDGNWHDVDGWRGTLDEQGARRWWVAAKDFGSGPFRWVVQTDPTGPISAISEPFYLPAFPNETLQVSVK